MKEHAWPDPTPTSTRNEFRRQELERIESEARAAAQAARKAREPVVFGAQRPAPDRSYTPEQQTELSRRGVELAMAGFVRNNNNHRRGRETRRHLAMDRAGAACACACDDKTPCLTHAGITGRRRWLRPR